MLPPPAVLDYPYSGRRCAFFRCCPADQVVADWQRRRLSLNSALLHRSPKAADHPQFYRVLASYCTVWSSSSPPARPALLLTSVSNFREMEGEACVVDHLGAVVSSEVA